MLIVFAVLAVSVVLVAPVVHASAVDSVDLVDSVEYGWESARFAESESSAAVAAVRNSTAMQSRMSPLVKAMGWIRSVSKGREFDLERTVGLGENSEGNLLRFESLLLALLLNLQTFRCLYSFKERFLI